MTELLPCPFCDAPGSVGLTACDTTGYVAGCSDGECDAYEMTDVYGTARQATEVWNRRPSPKTIEGSGLVERGDWIVSLQEIIAALETGRPGVAAPESITRHTSASAKARQLLASILTVPTMDREETRAQILIAALGVLDSWHDGRRERKAIDLAEAITVALFGPYPDAYRILPANLSNSGGEQEVSPSRSQPLERRPNALPANTQTTGKEG